MLHLVTFHELGEKSFDVIDGGCAADQGTELYVLQLAFSPGNPSGAVHDHDVHANDSAVTIQEWSAGVTGITDGPVQDDGGLRSAVFGFESRIHDIAITRHEMRVLRQRLR